MKVKVCGMKYRQNISEVASLLPDFMGFIFYNRSKRYVGDDFELCEIPSSIKKTGVFVNETEDHILKITEKHKLDFVQLHGDESSDFCKRLSRSVKIIKGFGIDEKFDFSTLKSYENCCEYFLFDTKTIGYGGSGKTFDISVMKKNKSGFPFFISGGIGPEEAASSGYLHSGAFALDVNSRFETEPGLKDIKKIKKLITKLRLPLPD